MPINSSTADIDYALEDAGVVVRIKGVDGYGSLRHEDIEVLSESGRVAVVGRRYLLAVREGYFTGLAQDVLVEADGDEYRIENIGFAKSDGTRTLTLVEAD